MENIKNTYIAPAEAEDAAYKLDSSLKTPEERVALVTKICAEAPAEKLTPYYLNIMATYILDALPKKERLSHNITTNNRNVTINRHETSYQGLAGKLEGGEDTLFNLINEHPDKNIFLTPKIRISEEDLAEMPELRDLRDSIISVEEQLKRATGKKRGALRQQLIEMHSDQYVIRASYKPVIYSMNLTKTFFKIDFSENTYITPRGDVFSDGIVSLYNPAHISALLRHYNSLKSSTYGKFNSDAYYLLIDLDNLIAAAVGSRDNAVYRCILEEKIAGSTNLEIQKELLRRFGIRYSPEHISSIWRNKIPKLIAETAQEEYILWYYTFKERGKWKTCSRCKQTKLVHPRFFTKNSSSKDGFYSICKECRKNKNGQKN